MPRDSIGCVFGGDHKVVRSQALGEVGEERPLQSRDSGLENHKMFGGDHGQSLPAYTIAR